MAQRQTVDRPVGKLTSQQARTAPGADFVFGIFFRLEALFCIVFGSNPKYSSSRSRVIRAKRGSHIVKELQRRNKGGKYRTYDGEIERGFLVGS